MFFASLRLSADMDFDQDHNGIFDDVLLSQRDEYMSGVHYSSQDRVDWRRNSDIVSQEKVKVNKLLEAECNGNVMEFSDYEDEENKWDLRTHSPEFF